jgi:hypothetical protein
VAENQPRGDQTRAVHQAAAPAEGRSIKEASEALEWMQRSVRGVVAGALKKTYRLTILSEKVEGRGTVYRIKV